jgi:hypothetical protein
LVRQHDGVPTHGLQPFVCARADHTGKTPTFSAIWDVQPGRIAADISDHVRQAAGQPDGLAMQGQVLFVRLPDNCHEQAVAEALQQTAQQLLPRLECDMQLDVQVCTAML